MRKIVIQVWEHSRREFIKSAILNAAKRINNTNKLELEVTLLSSKFPRTHDDKAPTYIVNYDVALCHIEDKPWEKILKQNASGGILVRMSAGAELMPLVRELDNNGFVLHIYRSIATLNENDWQDILLAVCNRELLSKLAHHIENVEPGVRRYFLPISLDHMVALSILCQGYLAIWAAEKQFAHQKLDEIEINTMNGVDQLGLKNVPTVQDAKAKLHEVQDARWWNILEEDGSRFNPKNTAIHLGKYLRAELGISSSQDLPINLAALLDAISEGSVKKPDIVLNALRELTLAIR